MSSPYQPQLPPEGQPAAGWHDQTHLVGPQSGAYPPPTYQLPTQPYPAPGAQPYPPHQPYAQPYPPPPYVQPLMPQQNVQVNLIAGRPGVNHGLHLILTLLTCGLWGIVWIVVAISDS